MHNESDLLELAKSVAFDAGTNISREAKQEQIEFFFSKENKKEIKASADKMLEQYILSKLTPTGLSILTEESGYLQNNSNSDFPFSSGMIGYFGYNALKTSKSENQDFPDSI